MLSQFNASGPNYLSAFLQRRGTFLKLRGKLLVLILALLMLFLARPARAQSTYLPLVFSNQLEVSGCILPSWGCSQNDNEQVEIYEDGSGTLNSVIACFVVSWGCSPDQRQEVTLYEDGSVKVKTK